MLAAGILALGLVPWPGPEPGPAPAEPQARSRAKTLPLQIEQLVQTSQDDNRVVRTLQAERLFIRPRRFGVFNIKSVNEAVLHNARFETHLYDDNSDGQTPLFTYEQASPFSTGGSGGGRRGGSVVGRVTRLIANGVHGEIFRADVKSMVLTSRYGVVEKKQHEAEFINATLQHVHTGRHISSRRMLWDGRKRVFVIPGRYTLTAAGGRQQGESVEVDLDFRITPRSS